MVASYDYIVVGSGFGGSVAALRLAEKGYRVLILESGRRFKDQDFAKSNWNLYRYVFKPALGLKGIMRFDFFRGLMIMSGAGVGGGSLVYANTLIEPSTDAFSSAQWPGGIARWDTELAPFYREAKRMLGVTAAPVEFPAEQALKATAEAMGYGPTFHAVNVGVFFGEPGVQVKDPYFGGQGPDRKGCTHCGGCMVGCRSNAKNTLEKNYLYFAEKRGAVIMPEAEASALKELADGGFEVTVRRPGSLWSRPSKLTATNVVLAAGVLGTLRLLLRCRDEARTLTALSPALGKDVRTNSESIIGVRVLGSKRDLSRGIAIAAGVNPNATTKIEAVRYPKGSDLLGLLSMPLLESKTFFGKLIELAGKIVTSPRTVLLSYNPFGFAKQTILLLCMQTEDSKLAFEWRRRMGSLFRKTLASRYTDGRPPVHLPEGNAFARAMAAKIGGEAGGSIADMLGMSVTAHILGGCPMGQDPRTSVIGLDHQVHGYPGLFVVGGAAVPANLGVNPSLTITAMAERAMSRIPVAAVKDQSAA